MDEPTLCVISLRYSSWSMRALLPLLHAGASVHVKTVTLDLSRQGDPLPDSAPDVFVAAAHEELERRRKRGSVTGYFPVLWVHEQPIHEALAIAEWAAENYAYAMLWPEDPIERAQARSLSAEMAAGFRNIRNHMSCHLFARVPGFEPDGPTRMEIERVFELIERAVKRSHGPFLFGDFSIADAMYFPVLSRFDTYGVQVPAAVRDYRAAMFALPAVERLVALAKQAPAIPVYDEYVKSLGGELLYGG